MGLSFPLHYFIWHFQWSPRPNSDTERAHVAHSQDMAAECVSVDHPADQKTERLQHVALLKVNNQTQTTVP